MPNEPAKPSGAEEFVAAEIELTEPLDAEQEKSLLDALARIESAAFASCDVGSENLLQLRSHADEQGRTAATDRKRRREIETHRERKLAFG